jgi:hypothetical protein
MATSSASLDVSPRKNWVEKRGGLPPYVRKIARALMRKKGYSKQRAIAVAINAMKRWSSSGSVTTRGHGQVSAKTRAKAGAAAARWAAMKSHSAVPEQEDSVNTIELARAVYAEAARRGLPVIDLAGRWRHGWIPLDAAAALSKAKGNRAAAARIKLGVAPSGSALKQKAARRSSIADEATDYAKGLSDSDLKAARGRQLSTRVRAAVEKEASRRGLTPRQTDGSMGVMDKTPAPKKSTGPEVSKTGRQLAMEKLSEQTLLDMKRRPSVSKEAKADIDAELDRRANKVAASESPLEKLSPAARLERKRAEAVETKQTALGRMTVAPSATHKTRAELNGGVVTKSGDKYKGTKANGFSQFFDTKEQAEAYAAGQVATPATRGNAPADGGKAARAKEIEQLRAQIDHATEMSRKAQSQFERDAYSQAVERAVARIRELTEIDKPKRRYPKQQFPDRRVRGGGSPKAGSKAQALQEQIARDRQELAQHEVQTEAARTKLFGPRVKPHDLKPGDQFTIVHSSGQPVGKGTVSRVNKFDHGGVFVGGATGRDGLLIGPNDEVRVKPRQTGAGVPGNRPAPGVPQPPPAAEQTIRQKYMGHTDKRLRDLAVTVTNMRIRDEIKAELARRRKAKRGDK